MADEQPETDGSGAMPYVDAEDWLAAKGVERQPLRVAPPPDEPEAGQAASAPSPEVEQRVGDDASYPAETSPTSPGDEPADPVEGPGNADGPESVGGGEAGRPPLADAVAEAVAYLRRATANAPASEGRLARKLAERDHPQAVVDLALERARAEGLVDDRAIVAALVAEWREKGHAPRRIRADLEQREFDRDVTADALGGLEHTDTEAAAFALARERADRVGHLEAEAAFRRVVGYLARRGHPEALARKAARQAVFAQREAQRTAER